jgi:hypothetical protein
MGRCGVLPTHVGQGRQALGFARDRGLRIASRICIQLSEEGELDRGGLDVTIRL